MFSKHSPVLALLGLAALLVCAAPPSVLPSDSAVFVDCDGDGFDDNAPDDDGDAIPDALERHGYISTQISQLQMSQMFAGGERKTAGGAPTGCGKVFSRRNFTVRSIAENRLDFDSGFGSGLGLGGGLGAGGACAGGVCQ